MNDELPEDECNQDECTRGSHGDPFERNSDSAGEEGIEI